MAKPLLNEFIKCTRGKTVILDFDKLLEYMNGRPSMMMRFVYDEGLDLGHNVTVYLNENSNNVMCWNNEEGWRFIFSGMDYSRLPRNEQQLIDVDAINRLWEDLDADCIDDGPDPLGYKEWRLWDDDFVSRHQILFANRDQSYIEGERAYLKKGTAILSTTDAHGKVNSIIQMASKEDRLNGSAKYRPLIAGLGKHLGFTQDAVLDHVEKLILTEGILDMYRMSDELSDGEVAACLNGCVITTHIANQLVDFCLNHPELERIFMYVEADIASTKHMNNIKSIFRKIQERVYEQKDHAPGISFIRYENIGLLKELNKGVKYSIEDLVDHYDDMIETNPDIMNDNELTQTDRFDADDIYTLKEKGLFDAFMINECYPGVPEMHKSKAIHIASSTGDGKTQTALKLLPKLAKTTQKWCVFSCFNIDECNTNKKTLLENGATEVYVMNSASKYIKPAAYYIEEVLKTKPYVYREFYNAGDAKVKREITRDAHEMAIEDTMNTLMGPSNGAVLVCTHNYLYKVCGVYGMEPDYIFIDESFDDYVKWYLNSTGYEVGSLELKVRKALTELEGVRNAITIYLDATGDYNLDTRYHKFFLGSSKKDIITALHDFRLVDFENSTDPATIDLVKSWKNHEYDLDPKDHSKAIIRLNLVDDAELKSMTRTALRNYTFSGNLLANMIISHGDPLVGTDGKKRILIACYKEVLATLVKIIKDGDLQTYLAHKDEVKILRELGREDAKVAWKVAVVDVKDEYIEKKNSITKDYNTRFKDLKNRYKAKYGSSYKNESYTKEMHKIESTRQDEYEKARLRYNDALVEASARYSVPLTEVLEFAMEMDDASYSLSAKTSYYCESSCRRMLSLDYDDIVSRINARKKQIKMTLSNNQLLKMGDLINSEEGIYTKKSKQLLSRDEVAEITGFSEKRLDWLYSEFGRINLPVIPIKQFILRNYDSYNSATEEVERSYHPELRMETRKIRYLNIDGDKMWELYKYLSQYDEVTICSHGHGRGTNRWRLYGNLIQIGSYREANAPVEQSCEDSFQLFNRCAMRCGEPERASLWLDRDTISRALGPADPMWMKWDTVTDEDHTNSSYRAIIWSTDKGELLSYAKTEMTLDPEELTENDYIEEIISDYPKFGYLYGLFDPVRMREYKKGHVVRNYEKFRNEKFGEVKKAEFSVRKSGLAERIIMMLKASDYLGAISAINEITKSGNWTDEQFYEHRKQVFDEVPEDLKIRLYKSGKLKNRQTYFIRHCGHTVQEFLGITI